MLRSIPRLGLRTVVVLVAFVGASLDMSGRYAQADHARVDDPEDYGEPHAGWEAPSRAPGRLVPATGALLGVHPEDSHSNPITAEHQHIIETEDVLDRRLDINNSFYQGRFDGIARRYDPSRPDREIPGDNRNRGLAHIAFWDIEMGRIPLISWGCQNVTTKEIAEGRHDDVIRKTAAAFKDFDAFFPEFSADVFVRWCWEMDGSKRVDYVGTPEEFNAAWIHIWEIFQEEEVTNVIWVWTANAAGFKHRNSIGHYAWDYYPGDEYVDWVSADGYNWGVSRRNDWGEGTRDRWRGFIEIFDEFMVWARSTDAGIAATIPMGNAPSEGRFPLKNEVKPIMIGEYAVQDDPRDGMEMRKAEWMRVTHQAVNGDLPRTPECPHCGVYSDIAAMVYFDINADASHQNGDWRIMSSPQSVAAYREHASDLPWYHQIHTIGWGPAANRPDVPPPAPDPPPAGPNPPDPGPPSPPGPQPPSSSASVGSGYWMLGSDGSVFPFGDARSHGDAVTPLRSAGAGTGAVDVTGTPTGDGYWVLDSAGRVFAYGDAGHFGGVEAALPPGEEVTSLSATPSGGGYWIFTTAGRVLAFGDAGFHGDMSAVALNGPVLDSVATPSGQGYYMVASDGGIFAFGDAAFWGSMGDVALNAPVQSLVPVAGGAGYWLVASDGGVFAFNAPFRGSMGHTPLARPVTGMVRFGTGYLMVAADGGIFNFSDRPFAGSLGDNPPAHPIVAVTALER